MEPTALLSADHVFSSETSFLFVCLENHGVEPFHVFQFVSDWECYDTTPVSSKKFFRNIQSTPWSTKSGLAGKDVANLRVTELTRKGLDDYSLRCLSNREFQTIVFVKSISEAVFVSNLLRHIRQARIDLDAVAAHMHGPAPPDKHKESARFMQPLLGKIVSTIKTNAPPAASSGSQSPETEQLAKANSGKRKLEGAGTALTPEKEKQQKNAASSKAPALPTTSAKTPVEQILEKELPSKPGCVPSSSSQDAVDKWLKKHQSQFRGKAAAFKKHVAEVCLIFKSSAMKYGLQKSHASKMSFANLSTFIGACQFEAA
ncbi:hypothetical protein AK812_SmicGene29421 [Symbiodinium microadriaticum]|uniref:Uncharacterized protein n=1 Tax=Symbiodinium microadriaticum TaxID=2951 RepID=A0A1Q9D1X5_SYMMI|nr:hypothetical protein AK812_SmicGene29421 [Symbiodinium microadriaticum]